MALPTPQLDHRRFQDIMDEARRLIPRYCPEWTDHNLSDPGITLIELFAWMTESIIYRLNRVPERAYIEFLNLLGLSLEPPQSARAEVTFRLTAAQESPLTIPAGTEVATVRTETQEAISFTTVRDLTILVPSLRTCMASQGGQLADYTHVFQRRFRRPNINIFQDTPRPGDALYLAYDQDLAGHTLALRIRCPIQGVGVDPENPPLAWEYWSGSGRLPSAEDEGRWRPCRLHQDDTGGLNRPGVVIVDIPLDAATRPIDGCEDTWLRCRVTEAEPGQPTYTASPQLHEVITEAIGGTVPAEHSIRISGEVLGRSDGTRNQALALRFTPVLERQNGENLEVIHTDGTLEPWVEVLDFADSGPEDNHYILDGVSGEIRFGPAIRAPDGTEKHYGRTPPTGAQLVFRSYRTGGGIAGNVGVGTINVLKSSIPYVAWVTNYESAAGGRDQESLEHAKLRAPRALRVRTGAVTAQDFEELAVQATDAVARARCLSAGELSDEGQASRLQPGTVQLVLVRNAPVDDEAHDLEAFTPSLPVLDLVRSYLDRRRLLGTHLLIGPPQFVALRIETRIGVANGKTPEDVTVEVRRSILRFLHPVAGGAEGSGWPFGGPLSQSDLVARVQQVSGVDFVEQVKIFIQGKDGQFSIGRTRVTPPADGLFLVKEIHVEVEES
jgi:predicted phage baseplate assembly protein